MPISALLRATGVGAVLLAAACQLDSAPRTGSSAKHAANDSTPSDPASFVKPLDPRSLATARASVRTDEERDGGDEGGVSGAAGSAGNSGRSRDAQSGTGGTSGAAGTTGSDEPATMGVDNPGANTPNGKTNKGAANTDGGARGSVPDAGSGDAGMRPTVDDPIGVLTGLANRTPQAKTAETINRFLDALQKGDAPASSIRGFLETIDHEVDCKKNPLATECLAACQAVSTTCVVCVVDDACRASLLDICGVPALAGCAPRR